MKELKTQTYGAGILTFFIKINGKISLKKYKIIYICSPNIFLYFDKIIVYSKF